MTTKQHFAVAARREGRWWVFTIPELGATGQAKSLAEIAFEAQDVVAMWLEVEFDAVAVSVTIEGLDEARAAWAAAETAEAEARTAQAQAAERKRAVVAALKSQRGLSAADTARTLGISTQRVYQLIGPKALSERKR